MDWLDEPIDRKAESLFDLAAEFLGDRCLVNFFVIKIYENMHINFFCNFAIPYMTLRCRGRPAIKSIAAQCQIDDWQKDFFVSV